MNKNFLAMLEGLYGNEKLPAIRLIMSKFKEGTATDNRFYSHPASIKKVQDSLFESIQTTDKFIETLIKLEGTSPYSIFIYILNENFSDILFYKDGYKVSNDNSKAANECLVPDHLKDLYKLFLDHFIENVQFLTNKKFDTSHAIIDTEVNTYRFNMLHNTIVVSGEPILVIRKQVINKTLQMSDSYINSIGASENQIKVIQKYAQKGNFIIFGETGSGKTTLLRYMCSYKLEDKRNLCIIEDTKELNIPVPISLLTNNHYKIKDLFKASLRQNPSSVVIGETRTDEIVDILETALTTNVGTTIHANSFRKAIQRILFMSTPRHLDPEIVKSLIEASIDCFIFMDNRKLIEIWEHKPYTGGEEFNVYSAYQKVE